MVIVDGLFRPEEDVKAFVGQEVKADNGEVGVIVGAFGKAGKCKVTFEAGTKLPLGTRLVGLLRAT